MINVYEVEDKTDRVLLDIDIHVFLCMMAAFGATGSTDIKDMLGNWGFTPAQAQIVYNNALECDTGHYDTLYGEAKQTAIGLLKKHIESCNNGPTPF